MRIGTRKMRPRTLKIGCSTRRKLQLHGEIFHHDEGLSLCQELTSEDYVESEVIINARAHVLGLRGFVHGPVMRALGLVRPKDLGLVRSNSRSLRVWEAGIASEMGQLLHFGPRTGVVVHLVYIRLLK